MDGGGSFVVVWLSRDSNQDGHNAGIFGRRYDSAGAALGAEFQVNVHTTGTQSFPRVASDDAGNFVVVWDSVGQDSDGYAVFARRYDSAGLPLDGEFQVNTYTTRHQADAGLSVDGAGNFVIVRYSDGQDGDSYGVFGRRYDSSGVAQGAEFQINTYTTGR